MVIFSQECVNNSVHREGVSASVHAGIHTPWTDTRLGRHPQADPSWVGTPWADTSPPADGCCCRRYASCWHAFLLFFYSP